MDVTLIKKDDMAWYSNSPLKMPVLASTGPVLDRCCQHRTSTGPVLARTGMFTGNVAKRIC